MIKHIVLFLALILSIKGIAQQQGSPYSFFGIGNQFQNKTVEEMSMGGVGVTNADISQLNFSNPAAVGSLRFTTFSMAGLHATTEVETRAGTSSSSGFSLSYVAMGIPIGTKGAILAGIRSTTGVGYNLKGGDESSETGQYIYDGSGGLNSMFFGGGVEITKNLSLGLDGSFLFGDVISTITHSQEDVQFDTRYRRTSTLRGYDFRLGALYENKLTRKIDYQAGLVLTNSNKVDINERGEFYKGIFTEDLELLEGRKETTNTVGSLSNPLGTTAAFSLSQKGKWYSSLEVSYSGAKKFSGDVFQDNLVDVTYKSSQRVSLGGYFIPKQNSLTSYFDRVIYRGGIRYENTGMKIAGEEVNDLGLSMGFGLPIGRGLSYFNIGFEYGIKGAVTEALQKEEYFNIRMSLAFSDKWFRKRTID